MMRLSSYETLCVFGGVFLQLAVFGNGMCNVSLNSEQAQIMDELCHLAESSPTLLQQLLDITRTCQRTAHLPTVKQNKSPVAISSSLEQMHPQHQVEGEPESSNADSVEQEQEQEQQIKGCAFDDLSSTSTQKPTTIPQLLKHFIPKVHHQSKQREFVDVPTSKWWDIFLQHFKRHIPPQLLDLPNGKVAKSLVAAYNMFMLQVSFKRLDATMSPTGLRGQHQIPRDPRDPTDPRDSRAKRIKNVKRMKSVTQHDQHDHEAMDDDNDVELEFSLHEI